MAEQSGFCFVELGRRSEQGCFLEERIAPAHALLGATRMVWLNETL